MSDFSVLFSRLLLIYSLFFSLSAKSQTLIINEVSNGPSGNKEYIELVVADTAAVYSCGNTVPPSIDIRGWIIDDNSGYHGSGGVAAGANRFSQNALWSAVPLGTIILIYNDADVNADIPANDFSLTDGNCRIVAPISNTALFETNTITPGAIACSYPATGWVAGGNWSSVLLANTGDCARIVDLNGCEVFSVCWASCSSNTLIYFSSGGSGTDNVWYFNDGNPQLQANWSEGCADPSSCSSDDQTPGMPNNAANQAYISQFNNNCQPITPVVVNATAADAGCVCNGSATATASGSIPGYTYTWFDAAYANVVGNAATVNGLCAGTYHVIASSAIDCADTATVVINATGTVPAVTVSANSPLCTGNNLSLSVNAPAAVSYSWSGPGSFSSTQSNPVVNNVNAVNAGTYSVEITDVNGCTNSATVTVTVNNLPVAQAGADQEISCSTPVVTLDGSASDAGPAITYSWQTGNGNITGAANASSASADQTGTYILTVTNTVTGCTNTDTVVVTIDANTPQADAGSPQEITCIAASVQLDGGNSSGSNLSYQWNGPGITGGTTNAVATANTAGVYMLVVTDNNSGCRDTAYVNVSLNNTPPVADAGSNQTITCLQSVVQLNAAGSSGAALTYLWSGTGIVSGGTTVTATVNAAGTYTLIVVNATNGCSDTSQVTVSSDLTPPQADAGNDQIIDCHQNPVFLPGAPAGMTYQWTDANGNNLASTQNFIATTAGTYILTVTGANGCVNSDTVVVNALSGPVAAFTATPASGDSPLQVNTVNNSTGSGLTYLWNLGDGTIQNTYTAGNTYYNSGTYQITLTVTDSAGCTDTASVLIVVSDQFSILVPNIFTPNNDGANDIFEIPTMGVTELHADIYNRWGELMYSFDGINGYWDGKYNGKDASDGVYFYIISATRTNGVVLNYNGCLTLAREK